MFVFRKFCLKMHAKDVAAMKQFGTGVANGNRGKIYK